MIHETHVCRDCGAEITLPYARPQTGTIEVPVSTIISSVESLAEGIASFLESAAYGPWRPEALLTEEGLPRRRDKIWLTNDAGDGLEIDEDAAAMLVEALRLADRHRGVAAIEAALLDRIEVDLMNGWGNRAIQQERDRIARGER